MENNKSKPSDLEALFFFLVFLIAVLIFCNRLGDSARFATRAGIAVVAASGIVLFLWRKLRP